MSPRAGLPQAMKWKHCSKKPWEQLARNSTRNNPMREVDKEGLPLGHPRLHEASLRAGQDKANRHHGNGQRG